MGQKLCTRRTKSNITTSSSHHYQTSSSAETVGNNDDLLTEILLCLPIKSLLKFKSVSKHWLSLISSPNFLLRLNLVPQPISGLRMRHFHGFFDFPVYDFINLSSNPSLDTFTCLDFLPTSSLIQVLQSCNGLLLCQTTQSFYFREDYFKPHYYICNPTTKQYTILHPPPPIRVHSVALAFDPSVDPHYIVIRIIDDDFQMQIYSSKTGLWRRCHCTSVVQIRKLFPDGVFWNNAIHWICSRSSTSLYFDLDKEELREVQMPPILGVSEEQRMCKYFGESRGHLHLIEYYDPRNLLFDVYEMERDFSGWFVKYSVDLRPLAIAFPEMGINYPDSLDLHYYKYTVLFLGRGESDEDSYLVLHLPKRAVRYNLKDKSFKKIRDFATGDDEQMLRFEWYNVFQYIQSLARV